MALIFNTIKHLLSVL